MTELTRSTGQAGTLESCDCRVILEVTDDETITIEVEGPMKNVFGDAVKEVVSATLKRKEVTGARVKVMDRGALDYVVEARVEAAIAAASQNGSIL